MLPPTLSRLKERTEMTVGYRAMSFVEQKRLKKQFPHIRIAFGP